MRWMLLLVLVVIGVGTLMGTTATTMQAEGARHCYASNREHKTMEVIYLIFVFTWKGAAFAEKVPQASIEQCEENGAALEELHRGIKYRCIPGLMDQDGQKKNS